MCEDMLTWLTIIEMRSIFGYGGAFVHDVGLPRDRVFLHLLRMRLYDIILIWRPQNSCLNKKLFSNFWQIKNKFQFFWVLFIYEITVVKPIPLFQWLNSVKIPLFVYFFSNNTWNLNSFTSVWFMSFHWNLKITLVKPLRYSTEPISQMHIISMRPSQIKFKGSP